MASINGVATPPATVIENEVHAQADGLLNKRKRDEEDHPQPKPDTSARQQQSQEDILAVLRQHDTNPSFLEHVFDNDYSMRMSTKKPKLLDSATKMTSLLSKLQDAAYTLLQQLLQDAAHVKQEIVDSLRMKGSQSDSGSLSVDGLKQIQQIHAFEALVQEIVRNETRLAASGGKDRELVSPNARSEDPPRVGTVLTLFGNAPTPKQLFSSMQYASSGRSATVFKTELPVEEMSLPNGLTATKIVPPVADESEKGPKFEEVFPPPYNLTPLDPPKAHKRSSTRDNTIIWEFKDVVGRGGKRSGYTAQTVTVGSWLSYGGKGATRSSMEKQRQRDRALSGGRSRTIYPDQQSLEDLAKEEEALFRRAYSSFAPSYDNGKALVPEETKNMLWWQKTGHARFDETFAIDPALLETSTSGASVKSSVPELSVAATADFASIVEDLVDLPEMLDVEQVQSKTDVDQVLSDIAELLETLASHQRIRNTSLPASTSSARPPISPAPILNNRLGKPDEPGEDEVLVYQKLKRELSYLVLRLPPYAIAKLDGQQFAALGVSKLITFQSPSTRGTMEEDQVARLIKYNSMATAAGIATLTRGNSSASAQHYSTTASRTPAIGQAANTRYGASGTPNAHSQYQRSASQQSQYTTPSMGVAKYGHSSQYSKYRATGPTQQPSYSQSAAHQYHRPQQATSGYGGYGQQYGHQGTPQAQQPTYSSQSLAQYQQRSQISNTGTYKNSSQAQGQSPFPRTASPAKPEYASQHQQPLAQRATYSAQAPQYPQHQSGSGGVTPIYGTSQPHALVNGFSNPPPQQRTLPQAVAPRPVNTPQAQQVNGHT